MNTYNYAKTILAILMSMISAQSTSAPTEIEIHPMNANDTCTEEFENVANSLQPGDELILHGGIYTQGCRRAITVTGTPENPITIRAAVNENPILTRPQNPNHNYSSNNIEIIDSSYLIIKGLRFKGGSSGVRIIGGDHITLEENEILETGNNGIALNTSNTDAFILRRNHIHHTGLLDGSVGTTEGEGIYVGCNSASCIASNHLIENNYIHHLRGTSSGGNDGIEIKPGSFGNIIRNNIIHDTTIGTRFPCIFVYGAGVSENTVEGNTLWNCGEAIQVAADAVIQNNLIFNSDVGITATPHVQVPQSKNVTIANNTVYGHSTCLHIRWATATNMTLANNAIYCPGNEALNAKGLDKETHTIRSNFVEGSLVGVSIDNNQIYDGGTSTEVFTDPVTFNFWPLPDTVLIGTADPGYVPSTDFNETPRITAPYDIGAYETLGQGVNPDGQAKASSKDGPITSDSDNDGIPDNSDNCTEAPDPDQRDTNGDGYGNLCDADLDDNGNTDLFDLTLYKQAYGSKLGEAAYNPDADFNGDGKIDLLDLAILKSLYLSPPGPNGGL